MQVVSHWRGCIFNDYMQKSWESHFAAENARCKFGAVLHSLRKNSRFQTKDVSDAEDHSGLALILPTSESKKWQHQNAVSGTSSVSSERQIKLHFTGFFQTWHSFKVIVVFFGFFLWQQPIIAHFYFVSTRLWCFFTSVAFKIFSQQIELPEIESHRTTLGWECIIASYLA